MGLSLLTGCATSGYVGVTYYEPVYPYYYYPPAVGYYGYYGRPYRVYCPPPAVRPPHVQPIPKRAAPNIQRPNSMHDRPVNRPMGPVRPIKPWHFCFSLYTYYLTVGRVKVSTEFFEYWEHREGDFRDSLKGNWKSNANSLNRLANFDFAFNLNATEVAVAA